MPWVGGDDRSAGTWVPEAGSNYTGTQGTGADSQFYRSWLQGVQPSQPEATTYDAYQRASDYMTAFQNGPLGLNRYAAAGLTGGLMTESDFGKIYDQPGYYQGGWGQQYGTTPGLSGGIGDAQWTDVGRHNGFIDYAANNGYINGQPFGANYGYIEQELQGPEGAAYRRLLGATDLQSGVNAGLRYERPGEPHADWRLANAAATYANTASPMGWIDSPTGPVWGSTGTGGSGYGNWNQFGIPGGSGYGNYNYSGSTPSFMDPASYGGGGGYGGGYDGYGGGYNQFSGDAAAGWNNPAFSYGGGGGYSGGFGNAQYASSSGGGQWVGGSDTSAGTWVPDAPSAASLNGFDSGSGGGGDMGYGWATQQGHHDYMTAAQQMYANTVAQGQASQANYAAQDAALAAQLAQSSSYNPQYSPASYSQNFGGNLAYQSGYDPYTTQYQAY